VVVALGALFPAVSLAVDGGDAEEPTKQAGEDRWVPSLAIIGGVTIQQQDGNSDSFMVDLNSNSTSGEILPTFAADRDLAVEGNPSCIRGPEPNAPCASKPGGLSGTSFNAENANGQGSSLITQVDTLVFGANLGVAFPVEVLERQLRIKPSVGWISYEVEADGLVVDAACGDPNSIPPSTRCNDFLREMTLAASDSQRFNGIGPGVDVEMDAGQLGPLGVSLFLGGRAYAIVGDRDMSFSDTKSYDDQLGTDDATALFEVKVDPWIFRAHVGIRFHYLGNQD